MDPKEVQPAVFLPRQGDQAPEPAPWVMTEADVIRFCRLDGIKSPYFALRRYRMKGWLKATQIGNHVRYTLPDVLEFLETAKKRNPR